MYTIVLKDDNLLVTTIKKRLIQKSSSIDCLRFLVYPTYKNEEMNNYLVSMEYITPVTKTLKKELLHNSNTNYKKYLQYILPVTSAITSEYGDVKLRLTFTRDKEDENGGITRFVRKTCSTTINILPSDNFEGTIPDTIPETELDIINGRISEIESQINDLSNGKADNIILSSDGLQLTSNGDPIGMTVDIEDLSNTIIDSNTEGLIKIVEF